VQVKRLRIAKKTEFKGEQRQRAEWEGLNLAGLPTRRAGRVVSLREKETMGVTVNFDKRLRNQALCKKDIKDRRYAPQTELNVSHVNTLSFEQAEKPGLLKEKGQGRQDELGKGSYV